MIGDVGQDHRRRSVWLARHMRGDVGQVLCSVVWSIQKKVHLGNKKIENAVFAALPRPLATMSVHQKIILAHTLNFPDVMNKTKKESTTKDQLQQHAVQKRCDSEMPTEKNSA